MALESGKQPRGFLAGGPSGFPAGTNILNIPAYRLYGEARHAAVYGFFHIEPLSIRNVPNGWRIGSHVHPDFDQLSILFRGRCSYTHDGQLAKAPAHSCVYTPAHVVHHFTYLPNSVGAVISVSPDFLFGLRADDGAHAAAMRLSSRRLATMDASTARSARLLTGMLFGHSNGPADNRREITRHLFAALMLQIASCVRDDPSPCSAAPLATVETTLFEKYLSLVQEEIASIGYGDGKKASDVTVGHMAKKLSSTVHAVNAACRIVSNRGARDVIQETIGQHARRLVLYTAFSIKEISYLLGYSHPSHFVRFFKQSMHMTPLEFRNSFADRQTN